MKSIKKEDRNREGEDYIIKSIWVVLIDHSSSMGTSFAEKKEFDGFSELGDYKNKLIAAKEILFKQIASFKTTKDIAVIAFTGKSELLFKCERTQVPLYEEYVNSLKPFDGTDIAGALDFAFNCLQEWEHYDVVRLLVITDGLSKIEQAQKAAFRCYNDGVYIDVVLIDPSKEGQAMAETISVGGKVTAVYSSVEFDQALSQERRAYEQDLENAEKAYVELEKKEADVRKSVFGSFLTIIVGIVTVLSLIFGIAAGLSEGNLLFKISILVGILLIFVGIYSIYLANEEEKQLPIYIKERDIRMVSVLRRTGKKRKRLILGGWGNLILGVSIIVLSFFIFPY